MVSPISIDNTFPFEGKHLLEFYTREGFSVNIESDIWVLPVTNRASRINFSNIHNSNLKGLIKEFIVDQASRVSSTSALNYFFEISRFIISRERDFKLFNNISSKEFEERLISLIEDVINAVRRVHKLHDFYRIREWYVWCSEVYPEIGFSELYATQLDAMTIPGNPKGEAVRMQDPESGPLDRILELPLLINALKEDKSNLYIHLQQKAVIALSLAFGRNPSNLTYLLESDLEDKTFGIGDEPCYCLKMPRIKKGLLNPRDDFIEEYLNSTFAAHVKALINAPKDYLWVKDDKGRLSEQKRQYAINYLALETAEAIQKSTKPKKSIDWINHTKKKLKTLGAQLNDNGVSDFNPKEYLKEIGYGKEL